MDPEILELKRELFTMPEEFKLSHSMAWDMRTELRRRLLRRLTGEYAYILFGRNDLLETRCILKPEEWLSEEFIPKDDQEDMALHTHHGRPCGRKLERGEPTHRCLTCGLDETCVLCKYCFNPADHIGHNVFVKISCRDEGGICDCGDSEAWKRKVNCFCDRGPKEVRSLPEAFKIRMRKVLDVMMDFLVDVLSGMSLEFQTIKSEQAIISRTKRSALVPEMYGFNPPPYRRGLLDKWCLQVWDDDKRSVSDMRSTLLLATERSSEFINMITQRVQQTGKATTAVSSSLESLIAIRRRIRPFVTSIRSAEDIMREEMAAEIVDIITALSVVRIPHVDAAEMLAVIGEAFLAPWKPGVKPNESSAEVANLRDLTPQARSEMRHYGIPVDMSLKNLYENTLPDKNQLKTGNWLDTNSKSRERSGSTSEYGGGSEAESIPSRMDFTDENDPEAMINDDLTRANINNNNMGTTRNRGPDTAAEGNESDLVQGAGGDALEIEELFGPSFSYGRLSEQLQRDLQKAVPEILHNWPIEISNQRLKMLIFFDVRMHKSIRHQLTDLYVSVMLSNPVAKMQAAVIYADVYPLLVDQYVYLDRDTELSVTTALSTQLFTTPSVATMLMKTDAFGVYLNLLRRVFTIGNTLDPKVFRNRRLGQVFHELGYLLWRNSSKETVGAHPLRIGQAAQFFALFQGLTPMQRRADKHIEYENERWVYCYASMPFVLVLARSIAAGIEDSKLELRREALDVGVRTIAQSLVKWQTSLIDIFKAQAMEIKLSYGRFKSVLIYLHGMDVASEPVSLLNPVHAFLSWILEFAHITDLKKLCETLNVTENSHSYELFDAPMCTLAIISHISVGYWVRNGYAMRIQLQSYRDATLRDLGYARDIYLTQVALCILEPNTVLMNLIRHYRLINWPSSTLGDTQQAFYLIDEFIHMLNILLTDRIRFQHHSETEMKCAILRREILQVLGFKSMPYSELTRMIPESLVIDEKFDTMLADVANYMPPVGAHGVGLYTLKPELCSQFDPFYTHFTISKCEEAEKESEAKMGADHTAPLLSLPEPWSGLDRFTRTPAFGQLILRVLVKLRVIPHDAPDKTAHHAQAECSFNRILYLLIMAAKSDLMRSENQEKFHENCFSSFGELLQSSPNLGSLNNGRSIMQLLYELYESDEFPSVHPRIERLVSVLHESDPRIVLTSKNLDSINKRKAMEREEHKQRGKEVQRRVLAEMAQQQEQFMRKNTGTPSDAKNENDVGANYYTDNDCADDTNEESTEHYAFSKHCVLCQMPENHNSIFGILTYTSKLKVLRELPVDDLTWMSATYSESPSLDVDHESSQAVPDTFYDANGTIRNNIPYKKPTAHRSKRPCSKHAYTHGTHPWGPAFPKDHIRPSVMVQGCGHGVHQHCLTEFLQGQQQRRSLMRATPENHRDGEFLCPLCKGLNNCFMPVLWNVNDLDSPGFLASSENDTEEMALVLSGKKPQEPISHLVKSTIATLDTKFVEVIEKHNFQDAFHVNVRNALLEQMLNIKKKLDNNEDSDKTYGMRAVYRSFAESVSHIEVSLRGNTYSTPFGGLLMDQLPPRVTQFLRVFANYINTLTGFILSNLLPVGQEPQRYSSLILSPDDTMTQGVEMLVIGRATNGVKPKTVLQLIQVVEIARVMAIAEDIDRQQFLDILAKENKEFHDTSHMSAGFVSFVQSQCNQDPKIVYLMIKYHITVIMRRYALVVFSICGKYDPDDFVGMMNLPEHDRLADYLSLPPLDITLSNLSDLKTPQGVAFYSFVEKWSTGLTSQRFKKLEYPGIYRLIPLPVRLDMLFNIPGHKVDPAICLMCGETFDVHASTFYSLVGPCNTHIAKCGISQGIFLLGRMNVILLLLKQDRGTLVPAPYLDLHGEPDENMRRGRPHFLQSARYDALMRDVWLSNNLPSLVVRKLDHNQDSGGWETL